MITAASIPVQVPRYFLSRERKFQERKVQKYQGAGVPHMVLSLLGAWEGKFQLDPGVKGFKCLQLTAKLLDPGRVAVEFVDAPNFFFRKRRHGSSSQRWH